MNILSEPTATKEQLLEWVKVKNPNQLAINLLDLFWNISIDNGVNPVIVYCQSMKETGYMKFGGVLDESFKNTCGLKNYKGGGDYDPDAHKVFSSWTKGILAHVEHLALYAGKEGYPLSEPVDPRHFAYITGKCTTVESLSNNWAGNNYGNDIVKMCKEVENIKIDTITLPDDNNQNETKKNSALDTFLKMILKMFNA